jgi:hypothetical protein
MTNQSPVGTTPESGLWWIKPYAEINILAGFLSAEELYRVYPAARDWPLDVAARVQALQEARVSVKPRPEAGQGRILPVEEPEALSILDPIAQSYPWGPEIPVSYGWVEIANLIAPSAIANSLLQPATLSEDDVRGMADFSLFGPLPSIKLEPSGLVLSSAPLDLSLMSVGLEGGSQLAFRYKLKRVAMPIIVGFEEDRLYLLNGYGRVLQALRSNIGRLLCLVYYGLDLSEPNMGVRVLDPQTPAINHFGPTRLLDPQAPLVRDFLDPSITVVIPARAPLFMANILLQTSHITFNLPPDGPMPIGHTE